MYTERITVYSEKIRSYKTEQKKYAQQLGFISVLRLLLFLGFAWFLFLAFKARFSGYYVVYSLLCIIAFIVSVIRAESVKAKNALLQQLIHINENEVNVLNGLPSSFDNGATLAPAKGFTVDLNIFGKYSLFHLLNRTGSRSGKQALANRLAEPFTHVNDIRDYQACAQELSNKINFRQQLLAHTLLLKEEGAAEQLQSPIQADRFAQLQNRFWSTMVIAWPLAGIFLIAYSTWIDSYRLLLLFMILGLFVLSFIFKKTTELYQHISKRSYLFNQYAICFRLIAVESFEHPYLQKKQKEIAEAAEAFKRLSKLGGLFDLRLNIFSVFINGLFLLELFCARAYLKWNRQYQTSIEKWFAAMGEIELLNSLAGFSYNHPFFIFPDATDNQLLIEAKGIGHPLMMENNAVVNDMKIGVAARLHLITGSNMSGKSTFLRTLGLNMVLAQLGAPVFAKTFVFRPVRLLTSFHHIDSLEESTSYFYAELKCLQGIIQSLPAQVPALVLLDEVMRGTNSKDKHDGTALLIKKILQFDCLAFIATHDTELGVLAEAHPGLIENYCFESELTGQGLHFDFTMRKGVAQTKNATYLMQQMGII